MPGKDRGDGLSVLPSLHTRPTIALDGQSVEENKRIRRSDLSRVAWGEAHRSEKTMSEKPRSKRYSGAAYLLHR